MQLKVWSTAIGLSSRQAVRCSSQWLAYNCPSVPQTSFWCFLQRRWQTHSATPWFDWHSLPLPQYFTKQGSATTKHDKQLLLIMRLSGGDGVSKCLWELRSLYSVCNFYLSFNVQVCLQTKLFFFHKWSYSYVYIYILSVL